MELLSEEMTQRGIHNARICADGSQQLLGRDYWGTLAPVVTWSTLHLLLLLSTILNLKSRQVDYAQASPQADLQDPIYMKLPQGWLYNIHTKSLQQHSDPKYNETSHFIQLKQFIRLQTSSSHLVPAYKQWDTS